MRRQGYTILEMVIAVALMGLFLGGLMAFLTSGSRLFSAGVGAARGPEGALVVLDAMERDLLQCVQLPGDPRPPVQVTDSGLSFLLARPPPEEGPVQESLAEPVTWRLDSLGAPPGASFVHRYRPQAEDGEKAETIFRSAPLYGWEVELLEPDQAQKRPGWYVVIRLFFAPENRVTRDYQVSRLVHLAQPSSNFLHFPAHGQNLLPGVLKVLGRSASPFVPRSGRASSAAGEVIP